MSNPVTTPRRVFVSVSELARHLGTRDKVLHHSRYLEPDSGRGYRLCPLDEAAYRRWHAVVYARAQREKGCA